MLRGIRKASEKRLGRGLMAAVMTLLAGSFAIWGINDIFRGFGHAALATIGNAEIPIERFKQNYRIVCSRSVANLAGRCRPTAPTLSGSTGKCWAR
jgi:hypothetical protein